jgi:dihydrolipoamide dehydrogenase
MEKFDVVVIGAGPGGYPAAIRAAQLGASVAVVEKEQTGGTCLNWGCIPTKSLIACADLLAHIRHAADFGLRVSSVEADYAAMVQRKNGIVAKLRSGIEGLFKAHKVTLIRGTASFVDRTRLTVRDAAGAERLLEARSVIIAAGSTSAMPGFIPRHERVLESRAFLDLARLPASLLVLGGGVIGCEFACMAAQLGVKVTVVELLEDILMMVDADVRREVRNHMEKTLGIRVLTGKALESIAPSATAVTGICGGETLSADLLLVAVGRKALSADLHLEKAGIRASGNGQILVDAFGRTSAASVFAVGDVTGGSQLAHAATSQGVTAAENALLKTQRRLDPLVPACIFTAPEIGSVGLTEQQAREKGLNVKVGKFAFAFLGKAMAAGSTGGFVKWIADASTDRLLGAHAVGPHATELIAEAAMAVRAELTAEELGRTIHCHPTLAESWMEAAHALHGTCVHAPPKRG